MKKYNTLKVIVILQAVSMIAFAGFVIWEVWLVPHGNQSSINGQITEDNDQLNETDEVVASIATIPISRQELVSELIELYGDTTLEQLLKHHAIDLAAKDMQITVSETELERAITEAAYGYDSREQYFKMLKNQLGLSQKKAIEEIRYQLLLEKVATKDIEVTESEIAKFVELHQEYYDEQVLFRISWILTHSKSEAIDMLDRLSAGDSFDELAKQYSLDAYSAQMGGDLGEIAYADPFYDKALLDEAFMMKVGDIVGPVEVTDGFAVIYLTGKQSIEPLSQAEQRNIAIRDISLEKAGPLSEVVQELLQKYDAVIKK